MSTADGAPPADPALRFHAGARALQDAHGTRALADRVAEVLSRDHLDDEDRGFIESLPMFFLATADADGRPECSYKGGAPGFVRVLDAHTLAFPSYDGNGMFLSLGNVAVNPAVGLLFIDFVARPRRLRVNGRARIDPADPLLAQFPGAQAIVRVRAEAVFPNRSRYLPRMAEVEASRYLPREGHTPPEPKWKQLPEFRPLLPASRCEPGPGEPAGG